MKQGKMGNKSSQRGFTLVELSIVLVIIGLIVGGVLTGQALIQAAKIRSQLTQLDQLDAAMNAFRARFDCLPGDCNANSGIAGAAGNGDGLITYNTTWSATVESALAWQQMGAQSMVSGSYTPNAVFDGTAADATAPSAQIGAAKLGGFIMIGADTTTNYYTLANYVAASMATSSAITADAARSIDAKRDDGLPLSGTTVAVANSTDPFAAAAFTPAAGATSCVLDATTAYQLSSPTAVCTLRVRSSG